MKYLSKTIARIGAISAGKASGDELRVAFLIHPRGEQYGDDYRTLARLISHYSGISMSELWGVNGLRRIVSQRLMNAINRHINVVNIMPQGKVIKTEGGVKIRLFLVATMTSPEEIVKRGRKGLQWAQDRVEEAALYAQNDLNCKVIGLGAYTAPWVKGGSLLVKRGITAQITHGDHLTASMGVMALVKSCTQKGINYQKSNVAIVGAGLVGGGMARIMASMDRQPKQITLIARSKRSLTDLESEIEQLGFRGEISIAYNDMTPGDISAQYVKGHDVVVLSTTANGELLGSEQDVQDGRSQVLATDVLQEARLVVDMAMPFGLGPRAYRECQDANIGLIRIDGGVTVIPGVDMFDMYSMPGDTYPQHRVGAKANKAFACLLETIVIGLDLARDTRSQTSDTFTGNIDPNVALQLYYKASSDNFGLAPMMSYGEYVGSNDSTEAFVGSDMSQGKEDIFRVKGQALANAT